MKNTNQNVSFILAARKYSKDIRSYIHGEQDKANTVLVYKQRKGVLTDTRDNFTLLFTWK